MIAGLRPPVRDSKDKNIQMISIITIKLLISTSANNKTNPKGDLFRR